MNKKIFEIQTEINTDLDPVVTMGFSIVKHIKSGLINLADQKFILYLDATQEKDLISGYNLYKRLDEKRVFNANTLDYLLANPKFIPEELKNEFVFFWGTTYKSFNGYFFVRYLYWDDSLKIPVWKWDYNWLGHYFGLNDPAFYKS